MVYERKYDFILHSTSIRPYSKRVTSATYVSKNESLKKKGGGGWHSDRVPIPLAARSKAWVYGRSPAEIVGSNPTGGYGYLSVVSVVCCQVEISGTS